MRNELPATLDEAIECLSSRLNRITGRVPEKSALSFSGGVDSSLLLHLLRNKVTPYAVGLPDSIDVKNAITASRALGTTCRIEEIPPEEVIMAAESVRNIDPDIRISDLGFESLLYIIASKVDEDILVTGQGADEIFYGYMRFKRQEMSNRESIEKLFQNTLKRETKIAQEFGKTLVTPYLDPEILAFADLPRDWHIRDDINKYILRTAAAKSGVPTEIAFRAKKAAQFGSGVQKLVARHFR